MPRTITRRYTTAVLVAAAALTVALASRVAFVAPAAVATATEESADRFAFSANLYRISEGEGGATITVVRTGGDTGREASVEYLADFTYLSPEGCQYADFVPTGTPGEDYARASGTLRFAAGETSKTFRVSITDDAEIESRQPEGALLSLDFSPPGSTSGAVCYGAFAELAIHDNDAPPPPNPTPSPNNKRKIAFGSNRDGNEEIYLMDEDGGGLRRLTNSLANDRHPSWSPDGTRLTFHSDRDGSNGIFLMNADGTNVTKLATVGAQPFDPVWSPDGARIAFASWHQGFMSEIYLVNIDGSAPVNVSNNPQEDFDAAWSPDGARIAFVSRRDFPLYSVYVANVDGTGARKLVEGGSREPEWSPDGSRIAYTAQNEQLGQNIYVVNADGTGKKFLSGDRPFSNDLSPSWSSDGARIAFVSNRDNHNYEIYVMNSDGSGQTRLTNDTAQESVPVWQPQAPAPPSAPLLLTEPKTTWALALDSVTQVADPFAKVSSTNFSADRRTRISLFAANANSPSVADITAEAEDSAGRRFQLPVEHVAPVPGLDGMIQVVVRFPEELAGRDSLDYVWVKLNVRGTLTNEAIITIQRQ